MSDLDRPRCRLVIRVSSFGGRRLHIQQQTLDPGGGPELDGIRDLLLRKRDVGGAHVHRDAVALFLRSEDLISRDRDHLASLLILEEVVDRTRHRTKLHEKPQRREVQVVDAILYVHVAEDHPSPQTPKPFRNCSAISPSSTCENVSKSETAEYSASCSSR